MSITKEQKSILRSTWATFVGSGDTAEAGRDMYLEYFKNRPDAKDFFPFARDETMEQLKSSERLKKQGGYFMGILRLAINKLDDLSELATYINRLGGKHVGYGAKEEHFMPYSEAIQCIFERRIGAENWTAEASKAWLDMYLLIAGMMKEGMTMAHVQDQNICTEVC